MNARILVVDDEQLVRDLLVRVLSRSGHEVVPTNSADDAIELLAASKFDLLLTDVVMPGMDGFDLLRRVKNANPNLRVIVLTGHAREQVISDFLLHGADDYIAKPFQVHELLAAVTRVLGSVSRVGVG